MKKILYLIFFGLAIIACSKGQGNKNFEVIDSTAVDAIEIDASVDTLVVDSTLIDTICID